MKIELTEEARKNRKSLGAAYKCYQKIVTSMLHNRLGEA